MTNKIGHLNVPQDKKNPLLGKDSESEYKKGFDTKPLGEPRGLSYQEALVKSLQTELSKYERVNVVYDNNLHAVIVNEDAIQIFATMIHINPSYSSFKINEKAFKLIEEIQGAL